MFTKLCRNAAQRSGVLHKGIHIQAYKLSETQWFQPNSHCACKKLSDVACLDRAGKRACCLLLLDLRHFDAVLSYLELGRSLNIPSVGYRPVAGVLIAHSTLRSDKAEKPNNVEVRC